MKDEIRINNIGICTLKVPKTYKVDIDNVKTFVDVVEILKTLNITVNEFLINDKNKHLFKEC